MRRTCPEVTEHWLLRQTYNQITCVRCHAGDDVSQPDTGAVWRMWVAMSHMPSQWLLQPSWAETTSRPNAQTLTTQQCVCVLAQGW